MERIVATLLLLCIWFLCLAQVLSQAPCPTANPIFPPSGLASTNYTISGSFLNGTSISTTNVLYTITILSNTSNSTKFTLVGDPYGVTRLQITLTPALNFNCSSISLSIDLYRPLFIYSVQGTSTTSGSPGAIITLKGCFPFDCGDASTNYTIFVAGTSTAISPVIAPTKGTYVGRLPNYESSATTPVNLQVVTQFNTFVEPTFVFTLWPRGNITAVSPRQGQRGTLVTINGTNLLGIAGLAGVLSSVTFGGIPIYSTISFSDTSIVVRVNSGTPGGPYDILINTTQTGQAPNSGPYAYSLAAWTQLQDGVVTSVIPPSAGPGVDVTLCGQRLLGYGTYISSVTFAGFQSPFFGSVSTINGMDCLVATVPTYTGSQLPLSGMIVLQSDTMAIVQSQSAFRFAGILSVSPSRGQQGTVVVISGYELLSGYNVKPTVYLAGYPATVVSYNSTQITVVTPVPTNSSLNQTVGIAITTNSTVNCDNCWTFLAPGVITGVTPTYGQYGTLITITGTQLLGYGSTITSVNVGGQQANVLSYNSSVLVLRAPSVPTIGLVNITITSDVSAVVIGIGVFEYRVGGNIILVSPTSGQRGTFVTITGSNLFGFGNSILNVSFGGLLAVIDGQTTPTNSSIRVRVQSNNNTVPQQVPIIILSDKLAIVQSSFYWTYQVEGSIQNTTPSAQGQQGTKITILGTNLLGGGTSAQQVYLDGANAIVVSANSTAVMVLVGSLSFQNASLYPRQIYIESNTGAIVSGGVFTLQVPGTITSISPTQGRYGTFVTLRGSNLIGYGNSIASVTIAGVSATAIQYNSSWALLRAGPSTVEVNGSVVITADTGVTVSSNSSFTYQPAGMINSVVPSNVTANTSFIILGANLFNPGASIYNVTIGGSPATVTFNSPTAIIGTTGPAPSNLSDMSLVINSVDGSFVTATSLFTYLSLNISLIGTSSGQEGTMITIRIPSPLDPATSTVTLGGIAASTVRFNASAKTVTVAAPRAARPGIYFADVAVQGGGLSVLLPGGFMYLQEGVINTVQPSLGQSGTVIILQGTNLLGGGTTIRSATLSSVVVTNSAVTVGSNSNNTFVQLQLSNNPSNSGVVDITLIADTGAIVRRLNAFTYVQPGRILAVSPSSGQNGTVVTINGLGLLQGSAFNATNVTLADVPALISLQNDSQITVQANASAINTTGPVVITLSSGATISTANMTFQYLPQGVVQQVVPLSGTVGTIINITGTNLLGGGSNASVLLVGLTTQVINASMTLVTAVIQAGPNGTYQSGALQITADTKAFLLTTQFPWTFYPLGIISSVSPASWQQGTLVTITGTSLIGTANAVARCVLAGVDASVVQMSNSTVVCRANTNPSSRISNATNSSLVGPVQLYLDTGPTIVSSLNYSYYVGYISGINVTSGNNGTYVWISGAGFLPNGTTISNIFFGSVPVLSNFTIISNNLIIARVGYFNSFASASSNITSMNNITSTNATSNNTTFTNGTATNITSTNTNATNDTSANTTTPANIPTFPTGINITFTSGAYLTLPNVWTYTPPGQVLSISSSVGVPGDTITITGQNLVPANTTSVQVMLGQFPAYSAQVVNTSMITFRVGLYQTQLSTDIGQLLLQPLPIQIIASNGATVVSTNTTFAFNQTGRIDSVSPMAGGNGSTVVITGTFLLGGNGVTSVTLAGINATVISASESTIVVVAGQSLARLGGVVIESGGQRLTGVVSTVWTYLPPLTASQVYPLSGQNGTLVNITLSSIPPQYTVQQIYLAGVQAVIQNTSTPSQVIVLAGRPSQSVSGDVVIQFNGNASLTLYGAWTYSPPVVIFSLQTPVKYYNLSISAGYYNTSGSYNASGTNGTQGTNSTVGTLGYYDSPIPVGYYNTSLTISGSGFQGGAGVTVVSVTLAGIGTTILSQSDTSLSLVISQFVNSTARNITGPIVIVSSQGATYNSSVLFTYLQVQALASSVTPNSGQTGTVVNVTGSGLLAGGTAITQFLLAGYVANVTSVSDQQITIVASYPPSQTNTSDIMYRVNTGAVVTIPRAWWYQTPGVIQQVSPLTGSYGTTVTITGTGLLGGGTSVYSVSLASIPVAAVRYSSDSFVQVVAGDGPVGKSGSISIVSNTGSTVVSSIPFYYNPRGNVASINPSSGQYGTMVTIMGTSLYQGTLGGVTLAGVSATVLPGYSPSLIIVTASRPPASRSYRGDVIIVSTDGTTTNSSNAMPAQQFNYTQEGTITLVSPNKGQYGTRVAISGLGLLGGGVNLTSVLLGGVPAYVTSVSDTLVTVNVINSSLPPSTGDVVLISNTGATVVMVNGWTYVPPGNVTSLSPLMGQYGTYLNIMGVYLMAGGNTTSQVLIGNVPATILSYNDTLVRVRAGSLLAPGQVFNSTVTLISIDGGIVNSTQVWSYIPGANITSIFPPYGLPGQNVTIVGSQLLGGGNAITQVTVVGNNATNIQSSNTQVNFSVGPNSDGQSKGGSIVLISDTGAITTVPYAWSYNKTCPSGTFLNGSNNCAACHVECSECTGPSITQCLDCKNYKLPLSNGAFMCVSKCPSLATYGNLCVDTCASYQYMGTSSIRNASFCFNCSSTCSIYLGCTGPYSYQCMNCPVTSYKTADGMCAPCDTHCNLETGCRGPAASDCYKCRNSSFLFNGACVDNCPSTTYLLDDATCDNCSLLCGVRQCYGPLPEDCVPCPTKMYPDGSGICQPCNELCSASGCYGPSSSNCYNCTDGVLSYNGECKSNGCPNNTYVSGGFCLPCHATCGSRQCYGPLPEDCVPCPTKMYPDASGICQPCNELCSARGCYGPSSSNCYNCTDGVLSYNGECKSNGCPNNTYVSGGFCLPCHAACGSRQCYGPLPEDCVPCPTKMYPDASGICQPCNELCSARGCYGPSSSNCYNCTDGVLSYNGECKSNGCPNNTYVSGGFCLPCHAACGSRQCYGPLPEDCVPCPTKMYPDGSGICQPCNELCSARGCYGPSSSNCYNCTDGVLSYNGECKSNGCPNNTYVSGGFCLPCHAACGSRQCYGPLSEDCVPCPTKMYPDASGICQPCNELCSARGCYGPSSSNCYNCTDGVLSYNGECKSNGCPNNTYVSGDFCLPCHATCGSRQCYGPLPEDCVPCPTKMYPDGSGICQPCNELCSARGCYGPSSSNCYNCTDGVLSYNGECKSNGCPNNTYASGGFCLPCHAACGSRQCYGPLPEDCVPCPTKMYPDGSGICQPCNELCSARGCYGPSSSNCYNCTDGVLSYNGACKSNGCPNNTYVSGGFCLPCHAACGSNGCKGPYVTDCNLNTDPFQAGSGTVGITVVIILVLVLVLAVLLIVMVFFTTTRKKQRYEVGGLEMKNVSYKDKETPPGDIILEGKPGTAGIQQESAMDTADTNSVSNLDGGLYTGLGPDEEDVVPEKQTDMSLDITLPKDIPASTCPEIVDISA